MESWGFRMTKTVFLVFIWVCMGLYASIYGPTLIDLKMKFNVGYGRLSTAIAARGIGIPVSAIISGIVADKFPNWLDLMVALSATLVAIVTAAVPYVNSTDALWFLCFCNGYGICSTNIGGQLLIITMWRDKAAPPTHAMHGGFGIGAVIIPLLVNPLLAVTQPLVANQNMSNIVLANHIIANNTLANPDSPLLTITNQGSAGQLSNNISLLLTNQSLGMHTTRASLVTPPTNMNNYQDYADNNRNVYLATGMESDNINHTAQNTTTTSGNVVIKETRIHIAFIVVALITFAGAVPFYIYQFIKYKAVQNNVDRTDTKMVEKSRSFREIINPATYTNGHLCYGIGMFILLFVFYGNVVGGEQMFGLFVRSFSVDSLGFSNDEASYLNMVYWLGFTVARMLFTGLAHFIHIKYLISIEVTLLLTSVTVLDILGAKTPLILWIFTALQGLLFAPLFPSGVSYANTVMDVRGVCITVIVLASGVGDVLYSSLAGTFYDIIGPRAVLYAMQSAGGLIFIAVVVMRIISYGRKEIYTKNVEDLSNGEEMTIKYGGEVKPFLNTDYKERAYKQ